MENGAPDLKYDIPQCYVPVRKLALEEISRMSINPLYITRKCSRCKESLHYGPQCASCSQFFHYICARNHRYCCKRPLLPSREAPRDCPKCHLRVHFGPQCSVCKAKYHNDCVSLFEQCCQLNLFERKRAPRRCGRCAYEVDFGPKCPLCMRVYHESCLGECCGVKFAKDDDRTYKCSKCRRNVGLGAPMCSFCGGLMHRYCIPKLKSCCGKRISFEVYFIPSFKFLTNYYTQFDRRRAALRRVSEVVVTHRHGLRSLGGVPEDKMERWHLAKKKSVSSQTSVEGTSTQTSAVDTIAIVDVKTELEEQELDITESSLQLERNDIMSTPEPTMSSFVPQIAATDDTLKNFFDFLYNMVKKFPPTLQTEVKINLFKTVTEAEMNWQCNMVPNNLL